MKIYIICCVSAQSYTGKNLVPEMSQNALSQSDCRIFRSSFFPEKSMKQPHFLHIDINSQKLIGNLKCFGWTWSRMDVANMISGL